MSNEQTDDLYEKAKALVIERQTASFQLLQRRLNIGFCRANAIMHELENNGVIGPFNGSSNRTVLCSKKDGAK